MTLVSNRAFVSVWSMNESGILDLRFASSMPVRGWKVMAEKLIVQAR